MIRALLPAVLLVFLATRAAQAESRDFAIGVILGSPTGLSVLQNFEETEAVQAAFEYNIYNQWVLQADYLFKLPWPQEFSDEYGTAWIYYGPGVRWEWGAREQTVFGPYRSTDEGRFAIRFPAGIQYYVPNLPFDAFIEIAPLVSLWENTTVDAVSALGVRFNL
jgi:hypothetical protein